MGDEFLLNFDVKFQRQFIISQSCEIIELPWQPSVRLNRELKMETFSGRRRPDWQRKPGTKAAVAPRQK